MDKNSKKFLELDILDRKQAGYKDLYFSINGNKDRSKKTVFCEDVVTKSNIYYLRISSMRRIILKFLLEKRLSKGELAKKLNITIKNLDRIFAKTPPLNLLAKINLPLVTLYCSTKWS